ncbi:hypothetical protein EJ04DRAFT_160497 [Polyplosphaeria fusca]|uniref:Uncharacterized protein n=1 Tax=Polyplosphaeria fusca TaxID=682080 RepID=A0A9P4UU37_9PLEO|nr:hypothetical protein EJ04DRAFT_160497 [Polyplosphaeria fusca]
MSESHRSNKLFLDATPPSSPLEQPKYQPFVPTQTQESSNPRPSPRAGNMQELGARQRIPQGQAQQKNHDAEARHEEYLIYEQVEDIARQITLAAERLDTVGRTLAAKSLNRGTLGPAMRRVQQRPGRRGRETTLVAHLQEQAPWLSNTGREYSHSNRERVPVMLEIPQSISPNGNIIIALDPSIYAEATAPPPGYTR